MLTALVMLGYAVIALIVMGVIASEGIDENGNVYDDTAIICGFGLGLIWPISLFSFLMVNLVESLGKSFAR